MQFRRLAVPASAAAAGVVLLAVVYTTYLDEPENSSEIKVDRTTSESGATPFGNTGPPIRTVGEQWRTDVKSGGHVEFAAGQALIFKGRGLDVVDANTGKPRWHYDERDRQLANFLVTSDTVVLTTGKFGPDGALLPESEERRHSIGLDVATGRTLWTNDDLKPLTKELWLSKYKPFASPQAGVVVFRGSGSKPGLTGVDARTGKQRWAWESKTDPQCVLTWQDSDGSLLVMTETCPSQTTLIALDPASGTVAWQQQRPTDDSVRTVTREKITLVPRSPKAKKSAPLLIAANGRQLWKQAGKNAEAEELAVVGDRAVMKVSARGGDRLLFVDTRTGKEGKSVPATKHDTLTVVGDRVYGVRPLVDGPDPSRSHHLIPRGLDVIDPATSKVTTLPLPFGTDVSSGGSESSSTGVFVRGDHIYRAVSNEQGLRLIAYGPGERATPVETGGVPLSGWPDACKLTAKASGVEGRESSPLRLGQVKIKGGECIVRLRGTDTVSFRINWVARTPDEAHALLSELTSELTSAKKVPGLGDEAYSAGATPTDEVPPTVMRTGRFITVFMGPTMYPQPNTTKVMQAVDKALRSR